MTNSPGRQKNVTSRRTFSVLEPQNPKIEEFHVVRERRATDLKTSEIVEGLVGTVWSYIWLYLPEWAEHLGKRRNSPRKRLA